MTYPARRRIAPALALSLLPLMAAVPGTATAESICSLVNSGNSAVESLCPVREGMARLKIRHVWGFVDKAGQVAIEPRFQEVQDFAEGLAGAQGDGAGQWGFIDKTGQWIVQPVYDEVERFSGGLAAARQNDKWGYIDRSGRWVVAPAYESAGNFLEGAAIVSQGKSGSLMIDATGQIIKRFDPDLRVDPYPNALGLYTVQYDVKPLLQHRDGRRLPKPDAVSFINDAGDGLLAAEKTERRGDIEVTLHGTVDPQGRWVTPPNFRSLVTFENGLAVAAPEDGGDRGEQRFGLVDHAGKFVQPARYERIERREQGVYAAQYAIDGKTDFFDARGKLLGQADCEATSKANVSGAGDRTWLVVVGCGRVWALHTRAGNLIERRMERPEVSATDEHLLLVDEAETDLAMADGQDGVVRFALFDAAGKRVFSSDDEQLQGDRAVSGRHSTVMLVQGAAAASPATALPLALLIDNYEKVRVVTRGARVLSNPAWIYDSELSGYSLAQRETPHEGPLVMATEQGWGAIDDRGEWAVQPSYVRLGKFRSGVAFAQTHEKALIVSSDGKTLEIPQDSRQFRRIAHGVLEGYSEQGELVRIDMASGRETRARLPDDAHLERARGGLMPARAGELWGLVDAQGRWVVPARFSRTIEAVLDGQTLVGWLTGKYHERDGSTEALYGWLRPDGAEVVPPSFAEIRHDARADALHVATEDGGKGVMTLAGAMLVEPVSQTIQYLSGGWYAVWPKTEYGLLDSRGEWTLRNSPHAWSDERVRPFLVQRRLGETVLIDIHGRRSTAAAPLSLAEDRPEWWWSQIEGPAGHQTTAFYGFDFKERLRVPHPVASHEHFSEGVVSFKPRDASNLKRIGLVDAQGKVLGLYPYQHIEPMRGGLAMFVLPEREASGAKPAQRVQPRSGYLDRHGKLAIPPKFDEAESFSEERAVVVAKGNLGLIDTRGQLLVQGAWMCGREPILVDSRQKVLWPVEARGRTRC